MFIEHHDKEPFLYEMLAEECVELAHAALKYARILRDENPANASKFKVFANMCEEIVDINVVLDRLELGDFNGYDDMYHKKLKRWATRFVEKAMKEESEKVEQEDLSGADHDGDVMYPTISYPTGEVTYTGGFTEKCKIKNRPLRED